MERKEVIFRNSVAFVLGFTLVFSIVGVLLQTLLQNFAFAILGDLRIVGGTIIFLFGVFMLASTRFYIPFLMGEHKLKPRKFSKSYITSFVFGIGFAIGWTPCVGAILGSIYTLAAAFPGTGFLLLFAYSLGIGLPFLLVGEFTSRLPVLLGKVRGFLKYFNMISGLFLIALGLLVIFNYIGILATFFLNPAGTLSPEGQVSVFLAFVAGVVTFVSPCILPLLPAYLSFMAGTAAFEVRKG